MIPAMLFPIVYGFVLIRIFDLDIISPAQVVGASFAVSFTVMIGGALISMVWITIYSVRGMRYIKRFKQRKGMLCFVCDYDLIEGQAQCPECGSRWEPARLGRKWNGWMD